MATGKYTVHIFQLGLHTTGDCAIFLLVKSTPDGMSLNVEFAMLVDGGKPGGSETITNSIIRIESNPQYNLEPLNPGAKPPFPLKFNAVVITHWDDDHYGGVMNSIGTSLQQNQGKVSFFRYDKDNKPLTVVYCPALRFRSKQATGYLARFVKKPTDANKVSADVYDKKGQETYKEVCLIRCEPVVPPNNKEPSIIGLNLIEDKLLPVGEKSTTEQAIAAVTSPTELMKNNSPGTVGAPGIYIVAASYRVIGPQQKDGVGIVDILDSSVKNRSSIACMVMWPQAGTIKPRISHYFAGDLSYNKELAIAQWSQTSGDRKTIGGWIPTMKISHHGGKASTPAKLLEFFVPRNILCSAAEGFGHPTWDLLFYLEGWTLLQDIEQQGVAPILTTRYPYWLDGGGNTSRFRGLGRGQWNDTALTDQKLVFKKYRQDVADIYTKLNEPAVKRGYQPLLNPWEAWGKAKELKPPPSSSDWIKGIVEAAWSRLSPTRASNAAATGTSRQGSANVIIQRDLVLQYHVVLRNDNLDGECWVYFENKQNGRIIRRMKLWPVPDTTVKPVTATGQMKTLRGGTFGKKPVDTVNGKTNKRRRVNPPQRVNLIVPDGQNPDERDLIIIPDDEDLLPALKQLASSAPALTEDEDEITPPYYFIASSAVEYDAGIPPFVHQLTESDTLNFFFSHFHMGGILLGGEPIISEPVPIHAQDEFLLWLSQSLNLDGPKPLSGAAIVHPISFEFQELSVVVPLLRDAVFSSSSTLSVLNGTEAWGFGPAGTVPAENFLIMGLEKSENEESYKLSDILQPAIARGAPLAAWALFGKILGEKCLFKLDKSQGSRSALWFDPALSYQTTVRLQYLATEASLLKINEWVHSFLPGLTVDSVTAITKLASSFIFSKEDLGVNNDWNFILITKCLFDFKLDGLDVDAQTIIDIGDDTASLTLQFDGKISKERSFLGAMMDWITRQVGFGSAKFNFSEWFDNAKSNFNLPLFRRVQMDIDLNPTTGLPTGKINSVSIDFELGVNFAAQDEQDVIFLFTYQWNSVNGSGLEGCLWCPPPELDGPDTRVYPDWESHLLFEPCSITSVDKWAAAIDLTNLIPINPSGGPGAKIINIPDGVPTQVIYAMISLNTESISIQGQLYCKEPESKTIPPLFLSTLELSAIYEYAKDGNEAVFKFNLTFGSMVSPQIGSNIFPIQLLGSLVYDGAEKSWQVEAGCSADGTLGAHFIDFFDPKSAPTAAALIQHLNINYLDLLYKYSKNPESGNPANYFLFDGSISIGKLELVLKFEYTGLSQWTFTADLGAEGEPCTIQEIVDSIVGDGTALLPSCVGDIEVEPPQSEEDLKASLFNLTLKRINSENSVSHNAAEETDQDVVVTITLKIGAVSLSFLQYRNTSWDVNKRPSKRLLRLQLHDIPDVDVPLVGKLSAPFEAIYFMWVQDGNKDVPTGTATGFTKAEVATLNNEALGDNPMYYKLTKDEWKYKDTDVIVESGFHFVIVSKDPKNGSDVVMDYVFGKKTPEEMDVPPPALALQRHAKYREDHGTEVKIPSKPPAKAKPVKPINKEKDGEIEKTDPTPPDPNSADAGGGTEKTALKKSAGPFSISNIGLRFSSSVLSICFDASVLIGPLAMALQGFSIDFDFGHGHNLQKNFPVPGVSLQGMLVAFDRPPLTVAGGLIQQKLKEGVLWAGGIDVGFTPWSFIAGGAYGELKDPITKDPFTSTFVFVKLNGPLITLQFATISGVTGGFGYNTFITLPSIADVPTFPFLKMPILPKERNTTMDTLLALITSKWFGPLNGSFWVAAGLTVTAFQMLNITAVAVVQWDPEVKLGLYALAVADIPSGASPVKLSHVEMGIAATIDFGKGVATFEAQLAPSSFILNPMCHLSGGFALYYWFKEGDQQTKGDWVFSLGGYNTAFKAPPQYPVPPRLQIEWSLGPLSIVGQGYFAITPNVCMTGVAMHASLNLGVLSAWLDAWADFLINYHPFLFTASGGVTVGVRFTLDLLFVTINISIDIGATLVLQGPPFGGTAHVNFWVFGFDIKFGDQQELRPEPAKLGEFYHLVLQKSSPATNLAPVPHIFNCDSGLIPAMPADEDGEIDEATAWQVYAGTFIFTINCVFALSSATVYPDSEHKISYKAHEPEASSIYSRPMYLTDKNNMGSNLVVRSDFVSETGDEVDDLYEPQWELRPVYQDVPKGLWENYNRATDPLHGSRKMLDGQSNPTVSLVMGIQFIAPSPVLSKDLIPAFNAVDSQFQNVFDEPPPFPDARVISGKSENPIDPVPPVPPNDPAKPWKDVQVLWTKPKLGTGIGAKAVAEWAKLMGWADTTIAGSVPSLLVEGLQELYVAAPMVAVGA